MRRGAPAKWMRFTEPELALPSELGPAPVSHATIMTRALGRPPEEDFGIALVELPRGRAFVAPATGVFGLGDIIVSTRRDQVGVVFDEWAGGVLVEVRWPHYSWRRSKKHHVWVLRIRRHELFDSAIGEYGTKFVVPEQGHCFEKELFPPEDVLLP